VCTFRFEKGAPDLIEFARRHSCTDSVLHAAQRLGAYVPNGFECLNIFLRVSGHAWIVMQKTGLCHCEEPRSGDEAISY
jgi:hypothetical protein